MKICLVTAFPPSGRQLNEYGLHLARELAKHPDVQLTVVADKLDNCDFATDGDGKPLQAESQSELPGFDVVRCWKFGSVGNPIRILRTIRRINPDVVWFNLVFSSYGTPEEPLAAMAGLSAPALVRAAGYYTHITLHHILEHVDLSTAGVRLKRVMRLGSVAATRTLLKASTVSVLLAGYQRTLISKYGARNVMLGTHGILGAAPVKPDFERRGNPEHRIVAIGHWGTYKRLETLMEAFPAVLKAVPNAKLIIGGANHHTKAGYWESIRAAQPASLPIEFRGYIPEDDIPELFQTASVIVMPYDSATGSSGPAHQACEFGVPIVSADLPDFRDMAADEHMAIRFYKVGDAAGLAIQIAEILESPAEQRRMGECNYKAGLQMTMSSVMHEYLRCFELQLRSRATHRAGRTTRRWRRGAPAELASLNLHQPYKIEESVDIPGIAYLEASSEKPRGSNDAKTEDEGKLSSGHFSYTNARAHPVLDSDV